jgi:hypothetical protein
VWRTTQGHVHVAKTVGDAIHSAQEFDDDCEGQSFPRGLPKLTALVNQYLYNSDL